MIRLPKAAGVAIGTTAVAILIVLVIAIIPRFAAGSAATNVAGLPSASQGGDSRQSEAKSVQIQPSKFEVDIVEGRTSDPTTWGFEPATIHARVGDTVVWTNTGVLPHTVTEVQGAFDSGTLTQRTQWSLTLKEPGTFSYICGLHPGMKGELIVEAGSNATAKGAPAEGSQPTSAGESSRAGGQTGQIILEQRTPATGAARAPAAAAQPTGPTAALSGGAQTAIRIIDGGYSPAVIGAAVGDRVTWTNGDRLKHTVTADDGTFDSGLLGTDAEWSLTLDRPGIVAYHCDLHPEMKGSITVGSGRPAPATPPAGAAQTAPIPPAAPTSPPTATALPATAALAPPPGGGQVGAQIVSGGYNPSTINAKVGDRIVWTNVDKSKHTVTADGGSFDSGTIGSGAEWSWLANSAGSFPYHCDFHPSMMGTIVVGAAAAAAPTTTTGQPLAGETPTPMPSAPALPPTTGSASPAAEYKADISLTVASAYGGASGQARYENRGAFRLIRVELKDAPALKGASLDVVIGGNKIGSISVRDNGSGLLELNSDKGDTGIPASVAGQSVAVVRGDATVASGRFP